MIRPVPCKTCNGKRHIDHFVCDQCGKKIIIRDAGWRFCPYCGRWLDMDGLDRRVRKARKLRGGP